MRSSGGQVRTGVKSENKGGRGEKGGVKMKILIDGFKGVLDTKNR